MKKLFSLLIVFISIKCFGQVYQVLPQYGYEMKRVNATLVLLLPSDTVTNKTGVARIGTVLYSGNGTKWTPATATDTTSLSNRINLKVNISDTAAMLSNYAKTSAVNLKVNISDTAAMLTNYAKTSAVALKVNISDTATMLSPYAKTSVVNSGLALKVNISDTAAMLTNYAKTSAVNLKVNIADTASMLTPYAKTILVNTKVNISDTAAMLANYAKTSAVNSAVALKVNISDTATMLTNYLRKIDTASLSSRINLKVNISDTAAMLTPYAKVVDLNLKANINSPTFTGTVGGITQSMVGLGNVTNESKATMFTNATFTGTFATAAGAIGNASLANGAVANLSGTNTGDQTTITGNAATATALQTARTIGTTTGDATSAGSTFNGTANNTNALTLATVNSNVGSFGSATQSPTYTVNGKGLLTAAANVTITPAVGSISGLGTGVATALGVNTGSAGAVVLFNGDAGTPSALIGTNITGTASLNINGTVGATTATTGAFTTATASTSLRTPLLIGGTTTTSPLTFKTTTGVGSTGARHIFQVGNNGATEAMTILNNANVGIGLNSPTSKFQVFDSTVFAYSASPNVSAKIGASGTGGSFLVNTPSANSTFESGLAIDGTYTSGKTVVNINAFGVYSGGPYSADLAFKTSTTTTLSEKMRLTNTGNLLLGTTTDAASSILNLTSTTKGFLKPRMTTTERNAIASPATGLSIYNTTLNTNDTYDGTQWQSFGASTSITGTAAISGNVGIGTASPSYRTHIETTAANVFLTQNTSSTSFNRSYFFNNSGTGIQLLSFGSAYAFGTEFGVGVNGSVIQSSGANSFAIGTTGAYPLFLGTNGSEKMRITSAGNVGVGNTLPAYKLDVSGVIYGLNQIVANGTITDPTTNNTLSNGTVFSLNGVSTNNNFGIGMGAIRNSKYDIWFQTGSSNGGGYRWYIGTSEKMTMDANGSVAIGTTTPAASSILDVTSTTKGFLPPRMTTTEINAIVSPAAGLVVYNTTLAVLCFYDGTAWKKVSHSAM